MTDSTPTILEYPIPILKEKLEEMRYFVEFFWLGNHSQLFHSYYLKDQIFTANLHKIQLKYNFLYKKGLVEIYLFRFCHLFLQLFNYFIIFPFEHINFLAENERIVNYHHTFLLDYSRCKTCHLPQSTSLRFNKSPKKMLMKFD